MSRVRRSPWASEPSHRPRARANSRGSRRARPPRRAAHEAALNGIAPVANDLLELLARPDALGDRTQAERARSSHGGEQAPLTRAVGETPDERAVDLELST